MITISKADFVMQEIPDDDPDPSYLEQDDFADRLAEYRAGEFGFVGVRASITFDIPVHANGRELVAHTVYSPGCWSVESDSGHEYMRQIFEDECGILADMLQQLGVTVAE
jgi:hypothetical protein